jgi:hypothetical protein
MTESDYILHTYSRREAIDDGVLIDVTDTAKKAGFRIPVAVTAALWAEFVTVPDGVEGQDERGRLWDVLFVLLMAIRSGRESGAEIRYHLQVRNDNLVGEPPLVELKSVCGPNDDGTPCVTVMLPEED